MNTPEYLIVHHTGGTDADPLADTSHHTFAIVNEWHVAKGWGKIGYHYFIDKEGILTQGRLDDEEGAHTIGYNQKSLGICLAGNFDLTMPTQAQIDTLTKLLNDKVKQYGIPVEKVVPHRFASPKTCYGKLLSDDFARKLITVKSAKNAILESIDNLRKQVESLP
jgi:N-acetyl-anhydromuramyl-L-alanine amidase AmpD